MLYRLQDEGRSADTGYVKEDQREKGKYMTNFMTVTGKFLLAKKWIGLYFIEFLYVF